MREKKDERGRGLTPGTREGEKGAGGVKTDGGGGGRRKLRPGPMSLSPNAGHSEMRTNPNVRPA